MSVKDTDFLISIITSGYPLLQTKEPEQHWEGESDEDLRDFLSSEDSAPECDWCGDKVEDVNDLVEVEDVLRCPKCRMNYSIRWGRP